jgi:predicted dehydrogenase
MPFGIGIVGCGGIGAVHAEAARRNGLAVAGAWDIVPDRAKALVGVHGGQAAASLEALLRRPDVQAVAVSVPNDMHRECAVAALDAGKHVLLEKPMAMSAAECDRINEAAARAARVLQIGFVCRGSPASATVRHFIDAGRFGRIHHIKASLYRRRGIPGLGGWFTTKARSGGGPLIDLGVHVLDLSLHLAGYPRPLRASGATWSLFGHPIGTYRYTSMWAGPPNPSGTFDVEDAAHALVRCEGGLTIELNVTWAANMPGNSLRDGIAVWGDRAGAWFDVMGSDVTIATEEEGRLVDVKPLFNADKPMDQAWDAQYAQFIAAVRDGVPPHASGAQGRILQATIDAIYASADAGREVDVQHSA